MPICIYNHLYTQPLIVNLTLWKETGTNFIGKKNNIIALIQKYFFLMNEILLFLNGIQYIIVIIKIKSFKSMIQ